MSCVEDYFSEREYKKLEEVHVSVIMCVPAWIHVHVSVAPLIVVSAWLMAGTLWQLLECYYYCTDPPCTERPMLLYVEGLISETTIKIPHILGSVN